MVASNTARFSTDVTPEGTHTTTRGRGLHGQHDLRDVEVRDDTVLERPDCLDGAGRAADHALGVRANGQHALLALVDRHDGRLVDDDALATDGHERVGRAQVDGKVSAILSEYGV